MYRIEIVTERKGLQEGFIWNAFPRLFPLTTTQSEFFVIYGCNLDIDLTREQRSILDGFVEEGDIVAYSCGKRAN